MNRLVSPDLDAGDTSAPPPMNGRERERGTFLPMSRPDAVSCSSDARAKELHDQTTVRVAALIAGLRRTNELFELFIRKTSAVRLTTND